LPQFLAQVFQRLTERLLKQEKSLGGNRDGDTLDPFARQGFREVRDLRALAVVPYLFAGVVKPDGTLNNNSPSSRRQKTCTMLVSRPNEATSWLSVG
jgi:hypothetical protein